MRLHSVSEVVGPARWPPLSLSGFLCGPFLATLLNAFLLNAEVRHRILQGQHELDPEMWPAAKKKLIRNSPSSA